MTQRVFSFTNFVNTIVAVAPSLKGDLEWARGMLEGLPGGEQ